MATAKPRITITLTDHQHAVLSELSKLQKASMSSIVVELLDTTLPVLERLCGVLSNAAIAPQSVLDELRRSAEQAEADTFPITNITRISGLLEQLLVGQSEEADDTTATVGRRVASADERPPTSNRGVRNTSPGSKLGSISPVKSGGYINSNDRAKK